MSLAAWIGSLSIKNKMLWASLLGEPPLYTSQLPWKAQSILRLCSPSLNCEFHRLPSVLQFKALEPKDSNLLLYLQCSPLTSLTCTSPLTLLQWQEMCTVFHDSAQVTAIVRRHYVFRLWLKRVKITVTLCLFHTCEHDISRMPEGNFVHLAQTCTWDEVIFVVKVKVGETSQKHLSHEKPIREMRVWDI